MVTISSVEGVPSGLTVFIVIRQKMSKPCSDRVYKDTFELLM